MRPTLAVEDEKAKTFIKMFFFVEDSLIWKFIFTIAQILQATRKTRRSFVWSSFHINCGDGVVDDSRDSCWRLVAAERGLDSDDESRDLSRRWNMRLKTDDADVLRPRRDGGESTVDVAGHGDELTPEDNICSSVVGTRAIKRSVIFWGREW